MRIKGRGNSTWALPKKPYKLKLNTKAGLLGMPADKEWVLLANYSDKSLLRNALAFEMSRRVGMKYTPEWRFVELDINGEYLGNYLLVEPVEISDDRLNLKKLDPDDVSDREISGGYLLEIDRRSPIEDGFRTTKGICFHFKSPGRMSPEQSEYIRTYIQQAEDVLYSESFADPEEGYAKYLDVDSFVNWYLVNELFKNNDAVFFSSVFMYKDRYGKLAMGPVWDFDIAAGNIDFKGNDDPKGWWVRKVRWFTRLFEDPSFEKKVRQRWIEMEDEIHGLPAFIDMQAKRLEQSQRRNFQRWDILDKVVWPNPPARGSYQAEVQYLKEWLAERGRWMDAQTLGTRDD